MFILDLISEQQKQNKTSHKNQTPIIFFLLFAEGNWVLRGPEKKTFPDSTTTWQNVYFGADKQRFASVTQPIQNLYSKYFT